MKHLRELRKEHHFTHEQFGEIFNITKGMVGTYERGDRLPDIDVLKSMCKYFNVSLEYITDYTDQRNYDSTNEEIVKLYYALPPKEREAILILARDCAEFYKMQNKRKEEP